jgi:hypothetical protein
VTPYKGCNYYYLTGSGPRLTALSGAKVGSKGIHYRQGNNHEAKPKEDTKPQLAQTSNQPKYTVTDRSSNIHGVTLPKQVCCIGQRSGHNGHTA